MQREWWAQEPWWDDPKTAQMLGCSLTDLRIAADHMMQHFGRDWWSTIKVRHRPHPLAQSLLARGWVAAHAIWSVGWQVHQLNGCEGFASKLRELKEGDKAESIRFEMHVAELLVRRGYHVTFPREQAVKTPDILASRNDRVVAVECKKLGKSDVDQWARGLMSLASLDLPHHGNPDLDIELADDLTFLRMDKPRWNDELLTALHDQMRSSLQTALERLTPPCQISIHGIARVSIKPSKTGMGSVSGGPQWPAADLRRVVEYVFKSCEKFSTETPGVLAFQCELSPGAALLKAVTTAIERSADPSEFIDRLGGIVMVPLMPAGPWGKPVASECSGHASNPLVGDVLGALTDVNAHRSLE